MGKKFDNLFIYEEKVVFVRDILLNPKPESFSKDDALCLITCPNLLEAAFAARNNSYEDIYCKRCGKTSVEWIPGIKIFQVSGKCPNK